MSSPIRKGGIAIAAALLAAAPPAPVPLVVEGKVLTFGPSTAPDSVNAPLVTGARFTAMDLLKRVYLDLDNAGRYRRVEPVKPVLGATNPESGAGYLQEATDPALTIQSATYAVVRDGRHAIGFVLGGNVLIADWLLPAPAVGQAMWVQTDPGARPVIEHAFPIRQGEAAALVSNSHLDSGEGFESYRLYAQGFSGMREVYDGPGLYSSLQPDARCASLDIRQTLSSVRPLTSRHNGYADIAMTVTETTNCTNNEAADTKVRRFPFTLVWNARTKRYRGGSPALEAINRRRKRGQP